MKKQELADKVSKIASWIENNQDKKTSTNPQDVKNYNSMVSAYKELRPLIAEQIPVEEEFPTVEMIPGMEEALPPREEPTAGEKAYGAFETARALISSLPGQMVGSPYGFAKGLIKAVEEGTYGTQAGIKTVSDEMEKYAGVTTVEPKTPEGIRQTKTVAEKLGALPPTVGIGRGLRVPAQRQLEMMKYEARPDKTKLPMPEELRQLEGMRPTVVPGEKTPILEGMKETAKDIALDVVEAPREVKPRKHYFTLDEKRRMSTYYPESSKYHEELERLSETPTQLDSLLNEATKEGISGRRARIKIAEIARINDDVKKAADDLGIDLPIDVMSENIQLRNSVGALFRSRPGSEAEAIWQAKVRDVSNKADKLINDEIDPIAYGKEGPSLDTVSTTIKEGIEKQVKDLEDAANDIYKPINEKYKGDIVKGVNLRNYLEGILADTYANDINLMPSPVRTILTRLREGNYQYSSLNKDRRIIGKQIGGKDSVFRDADTGELKQLYRHLKQDQLDFLESKSIDDKNKILAGDGLIQKRKDIEEKAQYLYGKNMIDSALPKLRKLITVAKKSDYDEFMKGFNAIPEKYRKDALSTLIAEATRATAGAEGIEKGVSFGLRNYVEFYKGVRKSPRLYKTILSTLSDDKAKQQHLDKLLRNIYTVSKAVNESRAKVLQTGKSLVSILEEPDFLRKIAKSVNSHIPSSGLSPIHYLLSAFAAGGKDRVKAAADLFNDPSFKNIVVKHGTKEAVTARNNLASSISFKKFAKANKLENPNRWLADLMASSKITTKVSGAELSEETKEKKSDEDIKKTFSENRELFE